MDIGRALRLGVMYPRKWESIKDYLPAIELDS